MYTREDMNEYARIVDTIELGYRIKDLLQSYSQNLSMIDPETYDGSTGLIHDFRAMLNDHNIRLVADRERLVGRGRDV